MSSYMKVFSGERGFTRAVLEMIKFTWRRFFPWWRQMEHLEECTLLRFMLVWPWQLLCTMETQWKSPEWHVALRIPCTPMDTLFWGSHPDITLFTWPWEFPLYGYVYFYLCSHSLRIWHCISQSSEPLHLCSFQSCMVHSMSIIRVEGKHDKTVRMSSVTFLIESYWWSK